MGAIAGGSTAWVLRESMAGWGSRIRAHWRGRAWAGIVAELLLPPIKIVIVAFWTIVTLIVVAAVVLGVLSVAGVDWPAL